LHRESQQNHQQSDNREFHDLCDKAQITAIALDGVEDQCRGNRGERRK